MLTTGWELSEKEIADMYSTISKQINMPSYFYPYAAKIIYNIHGCKQGGTKKMLDVGCGNGFLLKYMERKNMILTYYGLELSEKLVATTKNRLSKDVNILRASNSNIPFKNESFDYITITDVLEHSNKPEVVLGELSRILKNCGYILVTLPNASAFPITNLFQKIPFRFLRNIFLPYEHPLKTFQPIDTMYNYNEIIELLQKQFEIVSIVGREYYPYITSSIPIWRKFYRKLLQQRCDPFLDKHFDHRKAYRLFIIMKNKAILEKPHARTKLRLAAQAAEI